MDKITHEVRINQWKTIIEQCQSRPKGQTAKQWLEENFIPDKQYYYWLRRIRQETFQQAADTCLPQVQGTAAISFAEMSLPAADPVLPFRPDAVIKTDRIVIELSNTASSILVRSVMEVLSHAE